MGDVINISRASDLDLFSLFDLQCPSIPEEIDRKIQHSACKSVGINKDAHQGELFKATCVAVLVLSLLGLFGVKYISGKILSKSEIKEVVLSTDIADDAKWRQSKQSWQAYIAALEANPFYQHLLREKQLFAQQYE